MDPVLRRNERVIVVIDGRPVGIGWVDEDGYIITPKESIPYGRGWDDAWWSQSDGHDTASLPTRRYDECPESGRDYAGCVLWCALNACYLCARY